MFSVERKAALTGSVLLIVPRHTWHPFPPLLQASLTRLHVESTFRPSDDRWALSAYKREKHLLTTKTLENSTGSFFFFRLACTCTIDFSGCLCWGAETPWASSMVDSSITGNQNSLYDQAHAMIYVFEIRLEKSSIFDRGGGSPAYLAHSKYTPGVNSTTYSATLPMRMGAGFKFRCEGTACILFKCSELGFPWWCCKVLFWINRTAKEMRMISPFWASWYNFSVVVKIESWLDVERLEAMSSHVSSSSSSSSDDETLSVPSSFKRLTIASACCCMAAAFSSRADGAASSDVTALCFPLLALLGTPWGPAWGKKISHTPTR